jgi:hypothetical protein
MNQPRKDGPPATTSSNQPTAFFVHDTIVVMSFTQMYTEKVIIPLIVIILGVVILSLIPKKKLTRIWLRGVALLALLLLAGGLVYHLVPAQSQQADRVIAGTVLDESTGEPIRGAVVSVVGRQETCITQSNGNFRLELASTPPLPKFVRLHVERSGYSFLEGDVSPGTHDSFIQLRRMAK